MFLAAASSVHTIRWVNSLAQRGLEIHLVYLKGHDPKEKIDDCVKLYPLPFSGNKGYYLNAFSLKKIYKKIVPDVINAHYASGYGTLARVSKLKPLLLNVWGSDVYEFPYQSKTKMQLVCRNLEYADKLASTSNCMANQVRRILDNPQKEIFITPFGIDLEIFSPKRFNKKRKNKIIVGNIKTLSQKYGIDDLIKATRLLLDKLKKEKRNELADKIEVHIYGEGEQRSEIEKLIRKSDLKNRVFLKGKIPHVLVPETLSCFDIFCCTSIFDSESFGVSVVEAMAMELPVVATDVDGFKEVMVHSQTGLIVKRESPADICNGLYHVITLPDMGKGYGLAGRKRVEERYNWENNVIHMIEIYNRVNDG